MKRDIIVIHISVVECIRISILVIYINYVYLYVYILVVYNIYFTTYMIHMIT